MAAGFRVTTAAFSLQVPSVRFPPCASCPSCSRAHLCGELRCAERFYLTSTFRPGGGTTPAHAYGSVDQLCRQTPNLKLALCVKKFRVIMNSKLTLANKHSQCSVLGICFINIVNPVTRQCSIMTQICPFKEVCDCTNLIEIMLQLECINVQCPIHRWLRAEAI